MTPKLSKSEAMDLWLKAERGLLVVLHMARAIRAAGRMPAEAAVFCVAMPIMRMAENQHQQLFEREYAERFEAMRRAHGLRDGKDWAPGEAPAEVEALRAEFKADCRALTIAALRESGEPELAQLLEQDAAEFSRRYKAGQTLVMGELPDPEAIDDDEGEDCD